MSWDSFDTVVPGKWVLCGEHAVLRGGVALAFPHSDLGLRLSFEPDALATGMTVFPGEAEKTLIELISEAIRISDYLGELPRGRVTLESTIPPGAGFGSSAALCVAVIRFFATKNNWSIDEQVAFATTLENRFHGKSSGMDVAVVSMEEPILFSMERRESLAFKNIPCFRFHDTGLRSQTRDSIVRVELLKSSNLARFLELDQKMNYAFANALEGLNLFDRGEAALGLRLVGSAMNEAQACFSGWGLVPESVQSQIDELLRAGALAVKLTGAGGGGYLVSLWQQS